MSDLKPCPFCGGEAKPYNLGEKHLIECDDCKEYGHGAYVVARTEAEAIAAWNSRAAMEFDNWFYLPKPKEPIAEVAKTKHTWDGLKVKTDVFYQVQEQAAINWAKELDKYIIKRICEVWGNKQTCHDTGENDWHFVCSACGYEQNGYEQWNYCPNCGAKVVGE